MKKILLILLVVVVSTGASAQSLFSRLHFGVKAGGNYSNFTNADFGTDPLMGFHAGAIVSFDLIKGLSVQEEFLFSTQGAEIKDDNNLFNKDKLELSYISVPILLKYKTSIGVYIEAGPQFNMLVSDVKDTGFDKFADKIDVGVAGGIGYQFHKIGIGARYYTGLTKVGKFDSSNIKPDFKNSVLQASLFYIF
ncbi:MAG: porin family protein [Dysgonomonas sp.]